MKNDSCATDDISNQVLTKIYSETISKINDISAMDDNLDFLYSVNSESLIQTEVETMTDNNSDKFNKQDRGTMTESMEAVPHPCRYCSRRMAMLHKIETLKCHRESYYFGPHGKYSRHKQATRNQITQTPAALYDKAEMSYREMKNLSLVLGHHSKVSRNNDSFCRCVANGCSRFCKCGENDCRVEWLWDAVHHVHTSVKEEGTLVVFHEDYSCGTSAVRGQLAMDKDQHFWEIKLTTPVYGTDMMIGVGTEHVELTRFHNTFCSMLGYDVDSWGISYDGRIQHAGEKRKYCSRFGQGTIIGIHLDMWHGTLTFFKNRQCLGVAYVGLRGRTLYPMACSTAARSGMKVISTRSFPSSLQFLCCRRLRQLIPSHLSVLDTLPMPPGLRSFLANNISWLLHVHLKSPPTPNVDHICQICMPLKSVLERQENDEGKIDEERINHSVSFRDSDYDSDEEEDLEDFSESNLQRHNMINLLIEAGIRSRSGYQSWPLTTFGVSETRTNPDLTSVATSDSPEVKSVESKNAAGSQCPSSSSDQLGSVSLQVNAQESRLTRSGPSGTKKPRLDSSYVEDNISEHKVDDGKVAIVTDSDQSLDSKKLYKLGKRKKT